MGGGLAGWYGRRSSSRVTSNRHSSDLSNDLTFTGVVYHLSFRAIQIELISDGSLVTIPCSAFIFNTDNDIGSYRVLRVAASSFSSSSKASSSALSSQAAVENQSREEGLAGGKHGGANATAGTNQSNLMKGNNLSSSAFSHALYVRVCFNCSSGMSGSEKCYTSRLRSFMESIRNALHTDMLGFTLGLRSGLELEMNTEEVEEIRTGERGTAVAESESKPGRQNIVSSSSSSSSSTHPMCVVELETGERVVVTLRYSRYTNAHAYLSHPRNVEMCRSSIFVIAKELAEEHNIVLTTTAAACSSM